MKKWAASVEKKLDKLEEKIVAKSEKTLHHLQKQEEKIYRKQLDSKDSLIAREKLAGIKTKYGELQDKLEKPAPAASIHARKYLPHLDTLSTAFKFLNTGDNNINPALSEIGSFEARLQQAEEIKRFIQERRDQLKQHLEQFQLLKELKQFNKEAYYYAEQIREYKQVFNDPGKIGRKAIELLSQTKLFQDFMQKNGMLASLFPMPGNPNDPTFQVSTAGLQTRAQINNLIQQQIAAGGPNALAQLQQNFQQAQTQLQQLKNKISQYSSGSSDDILPEGFKPNDQKTKSFFRRLELGTNIQSQKGNMFFPITSDIGMSLGYKLNDKSVIGIGASYKLGWGKNWNNIKISQEGVGVRSYIDWQLKGSLWLSGGYEMNYRTAFDNIVQLQNLNSWQQSGLVGLSKVVSVKNKFLRKTKLQLLWDFLSYQQLPRTQPLLFRIGYTIK